MKTLFLAAGYSDEDYEQRVEIVENCKKQKDFNIPPENHWMFTMDKAKDTDGHIHPGCVFCQQLGHSSYEHVQAVKDNKKAKNKAAKKRKTEAANQSWADDTWEPGKSRLAGYEGYFDTWGTWRDDTGAVAPNHWWE
eukprot:SAG31_NODE_13150_length_889_cov_3.241772_1_plen_137_part_00